MPGVHGDFHGLFRVVGIVPVTVFLELVTEYAVDEVLDTRICPAPVAFRDDVFHCPEADLLDSGKRPEDFIGGIVGEELRPGAVDVRRHDLGRRAAFHLRHQRRNLLVVRPLQCHGIERRRVIGLEPCPAIGCKAYAAAWERLNEYFPATSILCQISSAS